MIDTCPKRSEGHVDFCFMDFHRKYIKCTWCDRVEYADGGTFLKEGDLNPARFETSKQPK